MLTRDRPTAIDSWYKHVILGEESASDIPEKLRTEVPTLLSWITRGGCAVQCQHCIFPEEGPRALSSPKSAEAVRILMSQMPARAHIIHEGRQLIPWQIPVLKWAADAGYGVSVINNGQYATPSTLRQFESIGLGIDTLDISLDGTELVHNAQRSSQQAWNWAMRGLSNAQRILKPSGKLTSLYTLTSMNCQSVGETGELLMPQVDEWHLTTMSLRPGIEHLRASKEDLAVAIEQIFGNRWDKPVYLRSYSLKDFVRILEIIGIETVHKALQEAEVTCNAIVLSIHGVSLYFFPKSLWSNETLVIDADGWWRLPYSVAYTLDELVAGTDTAGNDISHFSIAEVTETLDFGCRFPETVDTWWRVIGNDCLSAEWKTLQRFLTGERR